MKVPKTHQAIEVLYYKIKRQSEGAHPPSCIYDLGDVFGICPADGAMCKAWESRGHTLLGTYVQKGLKKAHLHDDLADALLESVRS